jgi:anhydro-N-acetylmuramic acid kinase
MQAIQKYCDIKDILTSDKLGIQTDLKEALLMAVLGVARLQNMPANMPGVTGAKKRVILGELII